jgi:integrase
MRKAATKLTKVKIWTPVKGGSRKNLTFWCVRWPKIGKGRSRQFFKSKTEAQTFLQQKLTEQENYGIAGVSFTERHRAEYLECAEALQPFGATIRDAVKYYIPHLQAMKRSCTAAQLVEELLQVKESDGASKRYLSDLRSRLNHFSETFDGKPIAEIASTEIDEWLRSLSHKETGKRLSPISRNNFRRVLIVAFNFARDRNYCTDNPAQKTAKAKAVETVIGILTVDETARLLENAPANVVPYVAIGAFAGLRRAELERLDWAEVDLESNLIQIIAKNSKSARRRFVKIQPNLARWLQAYRRASGSVTPSDYRELLNSARKAAKIQDWPKNALRHNFASYNLAHFNNLGALSLELGHSNSNLVFQHYRQLVRPKEAARYWKIVPAAGSTKVIPFAGVTK